ncbi:hypothetical protein GLYMA_19G046233v4 [Glycine max]|nr:hypothetical protein GLYMA_19G046233v4 [Glycine max]KAH1076405.1 hypothetical protein GYH30_052056 [Glycine max]
MGLLLTYMVLNLSTSTRCGISPHTCNPTVMNELGQLGHNILKIILFYKI